VIIGLTGKNGSGKGVVGDYLQEKGFLYYSLSDVLRKEAMGEGLALTRDHLFQLGNRLRSIRGPGVLGEMVREQLDLTRHCVVDSIRHPGEAKALKEITNFKLIAVEAPLKVRFERMCERARENDPKTYDAFLKLEEKEASSEDSAHQQLNQVIEMADHVLINDSNIDKLQMKVDKIIQSVQFS